MRSATNEWFGFRKESLNEISEVNSTLTKHGRYLAAEIEKESGIPTYYYLYRVGGHSLESEQQRCCPQCGGDWTLDAPLFDVIYFKCDQCRFSLECVVEFFITLSSFRKTNELSR